jgi:tRNA threonylcarbamoyladenosine modification (KEOPS) complex Cgi121 subunit
VKESSPGAVDTSARSPAATTATGVTAPGRPALVSFASGFSFKGEGRDLRVLATRLEPGAAICQSRFVAGGPHVRAILYQASESWRRGLRLAKNPSIDLLLRVTCQSQISRALEASGLEDSKSVALFGLLDSKDGVERCRSILLEEEGGAVRDDSLLDLTPAKEVFLRRFHGVPPRFNSVQLVSLLEERSALLVLSK